MSLSLLLRLRVQALLGLVASLPAAATNVPAQRLTVLLLLLLLQGLAAALPVAAAAGGAFLGPLLPHPGSPLLLGQKQLDADRCRSRPCEVVHRPQTPCQILNREG